MPSFDGKTDVCQLLPPTVTATRTDPKPFRRPSVRSVISSLMPAGMALLTEMGFAVTAGIVISAFVMSSFLVPSVIALLGTRAWWPRRVKVSPPAEDRESALTASGAR